MQYVSIIIGNLSIYGWRFNTVNGIRVHAICRTRVISNVNGEVSIP